MRYVDKQKWDTRVGYRVGREGHTVDHNYRDVDIIKCILNDS